MGQAKERKLKILSAMSGSNGVDIEVEQVARYRPVSGHVIVRMVDRRLTRGGLHLPSNMEKSLREGEVLMVGPGRLRDDGGRIPVALKVGEIVVFADPTALPLDPENPGIRLVWEDNVLAIRIDDSPLENDHE